MNYKVGYQVGVPALILALSGCGGSSSSTPTAVKPSAQTVSIQAIDGYLKNAEVYIDRNNNNVADNDELVGKTDINGRLSITLKQSDLAYNRIVRAIAGVTSDGDVGGMVADSYEMIAGPDSTTITPFTTLAKVQNKSVSELAADLNITEAALSGDYISTKTSNDEAKQAHLLARSTVMVLGSSLADTISDNNLASNIDKLNTESKTVSSAQMDSKIVLLDDSGNAQIDNMLPKLDQFMDNKSYYSFSLNSFWLHGCAQGCGSDDGRTSWTFDYKNRTVLLDGTSFTLNFGDEKSTGRDDENSFYMTGGNLAVGARSEMQDQLIYTADGFGLALSIDDDLQFYSSTNPVDNSLSGFNGIDLAGTSFAGKVMYHLYDPKRYTDPDSNRPWSSSPKVDIENAISISDAANGVITFNGNDYTVITSNRDLYVLKEKTSNHPSILFKKAALANHISSVWVSSTQASKPDDS